MGKYSKYSKDSEEEETEKINLYEKYIFTSEPLKSFFFLALIEVIVWTVFSFMEREVSTKASFSLLKLISLDSYCSHWRTGT